MGWKRGYRREEEREREREREADNLMCIQDGGQVGLIIVVVILLLYAMVVTIFTILLFRQRRKGMTAETECKGPDPYMDLQPRPEDEGGRTYQEMATISKTLSNTPEDGSLPQEPTDSAVYENQAAAMYHEYDEDKTNEGGTYETVSSPIRRNQNS
ncbi:uncharacterized protein LOC121430598 [Lytechinus variegatus]|uniref:uncharacterized protein LOC121430598 n=1 Tax=Lytechinus variegatus TaxID=7654 RepID=UPI001BB271AE|nr:uncharacterized protein LOC121430598 [Lytechinus variegatus]